MLSTGPVHYEVGGNVDATCFGGIAAVHRLVTRLGLPEAIDTDVELLKVHLPYYESDHVLNLAYNVALRRHPVGGHRAKLDRVTALALRPTPISTTMWRDVEAAAGSVGGAVGFPPFEARLGATSRQRAG